MTLWHIEVIKHFFNHRVLSVIFDTSDLFNIKSSNTFLNVILWFTCVPLVWKDYLHLMVKYQCKMPINRSSSTEVFSGKVVLKICSKFTGSPRGFFILVVCVCFLLYTYIVPIFMFKLSPMPSVISIKLKTNFIDIVNLLHIFRKPLPNNTSGGLLLCKISLCNQNWRLKIKNV